MSTPIIDFRVSCPIPEGLDRYLKPTGRLADYAKHYGDRVFGNEEEHRYMKPEEFIAFLDEQGVDKAVIKTSDMTTILGTKFPPTSCMNTSKITRTASLERPDATRFAAWKRCATWSAT